MEIRLFSASCGSRHSASRLRISAWAASLVGLMLAQPAYADSVVGYSIRARQRTTIRICSAEQCKQDTEATESNIYFSPDGTVVESGVGKIQRANLNQWFSKNNDGVREKWSIHNGDGILHVEAGAFNVMLRYIKTGSGCRIEQRTTSPDPKLKVTGFYTLASCELVQGERDYQGAQ